MKSVAASTRTLRSVVLDIVRPQHLLAVVVVAAFGVLHLAGVTTLALRTSFITAGWHLAGVMLLVTTVLAAWQVGRRLRGQPSSLPGFVTGLAVGLPILGGGLIAARVVPVRWDGNMTLKGWVVVMGLVALSAAYHVWRTRGQVRPWRSLSTYLCQLSLEALRFIWSWAPFVVLLAAYENALTLVVRINPDLHDPAIFELDDLLFGGHLDIWFQRLVTPPTTVRLLGRAFTISVTEVMSFFYDSLYLYPIVIGMVLYLQGRMREFRTFLLAFVVAGYVGYVGYVIVPVIGPAFYYSGLYEVDLATGRGVDRLGETRSEDKDDATSFYLLAQRLSDKSSYGGQIPRNCYPSLHTAWGVILLIFSWRYLRKLFYVFLVPLILLIAATSYLRWHYVTDVVAGAFLAMFMSTVTSWFEQFWERLRGVEVPAGERQSGLKKWARIVVNILIPLGFNIFVIGYVYTSDSGSQREALARTLGESFIARDVPAAKEQERVSAIFGGAVELVSVRLEPERWRVGDLVEMTMWWRCIQPLPGDWKIFVHLRVGGERPSDKNLVNLDHHPVFGVYPTSLWNPGDAVKDVVVFRVPDLPRGAPLAVWVGLFSESETSKRLGVTSGPAGGQRVFENAVEVVSGVPER